MHKSKIEWCNFSWNPITGCLHSCPYCYARKQSKRFCGDIRLNKASPQIQHYEDKLWVLEKAFHNTNDRVIPLPLGFEPTLHRYRLSMPEMKKLSANIFVGSTADVFGHWVPDEWIAEIFAACKAAPWHNYMFLTKNPQRYVQLDEAGLLPTNANMWYGASAGSAEQLKKAVALGELPGKARTFLSIEPLHENIAGLEDWQEMLDGTAWFNWVIVGAETGGRRGKVVPERKWIENIIADCRKASVPVFLKDNLKGIWFGDLSQEYPRSLAVPSWENRPCHKVFVNRVRDKKECRQCKKSVHGEPAWRISARFYICQHCYTGGKDDGKTSKQHNRSTIPPDATV